jgi:hypothetical protein
MDKEKLIRMCEDFRDTGFNPNSPLVAQEVYSFLTELLEELRKN